MKTQQILLTITTAKDIKDLVDHVAGRAYTLDGVTDVTASIYSNSSILDLGSETVQQQLRDAGWREPLRPAPVVELKRGQEDGQDEPCDEFRPVGEVVLLRSLFFPRRAIEASEDLPIGTEIYVKV